MSVEAENGTDSDLLSTIAFLLGPGRFTGFPGALRTHFIGTGMGAFCGES